MTDVDDKPRPTYTIEQIRQTMDAVEKWLTVSPHYPDVVQPTELFSELLAWAARLTKDTPF